MSKSYLFTSESVSEGHPDKVADQISDAVLDTYLQADPNAKVACETLVTENRVVISGEFKTKHKFEPDYESIVKDVVKHVGYDDPAYGFDYKTLQINAYCKPQSGDINQGVEHNDGSIGAGDQGLMFGYACNETPELMPLPILLAHKLVQRQALLRKAGQIKWLRPDAKSQVTIQYEGANPVSVKTVVLSTQHAPDVSRNEIEQRVIEEIIKTVIPAEFRSSDIKYLVNPTGNFEIGGPLGDTGLTGRKIIVDTYGGSCPHGGGAFSGKDPTKVDRSAAYAARYVAKNIVAAGLAEKCQVQLAYAIGVAQPVSIMLDFGGTGKVDEELVQEAVRELFDLTPKGIITMLDLLRPIYLKTASYGHFGRAIPEFTWEKTDKAAELLRWFEQQQPKVLTRKLAKQFIVCGKV